MLAPERESHYPNLRTHGYKVTSEETVNTTKKYNCVTLAACDDLTIWWEPSTLNSRPVRKPGRYWPDGIPTDGTLESYVMLFESLGYSRCDEDKVEILYEKIALYGWPENEFSHVAYQLYRGWISKLGEWEDIRHRTLSGLEGDYYGGVRILMKKRCTLRGFFARAFYNQTVRLWPIKRRGI